MHLRPCFPRALALLLAAAPCALLGSACRTTDGDLRDEEVATGGESPSLWESISTAAGREELAGRIDTWLGEVYDEIRGLRAELVTVSGNERQALEMSLDRLQDRWFDLQNQLIEMRAADEDEWQDDRGRLLASLRRFRDAWLETRRKLTDEEPVATAGA